MSGNSHTLATNTLTSSDKKNAFMKREQHNSKTELLNSQLAAKLREAQENPDVPRAGTITDLKRMTEEAYVAASPQVPLNSTPHPRVQVSAPVIERRVPVEDVASVSVPMEPVAAPIKKTKSKKEKSYSLDEEDHDLLAHLSRVEAIRLNRRVPSSEILRHMINFAKANMKDEQVVPTSDGLGLQIDG